MHRFTEIELKLRLKPSAVRKALTVLERASRLAPRVRWYQSTYFDTRSGRLYRARHALRLREEDGVTVQTLKRDALAEAFTRGEWSDAVRGATPDLRAGVSGRRLARLTGGAGLVPQFTVDFTRHTFALRAREKAKIDVAVDVGTIGAKGRPAKIALCEIEMELKSGEPLALYRAASRLARRIAVRQEPRSKAASGYALLGRHAAVARLEPPRLRQETTVGEALRASARRYYAQYLANMPMMLSGEVDAIHMMRVAVRRLRSAIAAARPFIPNANARSVNTRLRTIQHALSELRDLDVTTSHLAADRAARSLRAGGRRKTETWLEARRNSALERAIAAIDSPSFTTHWLDIMAWFEQIGEGGGGSSLKTRLADAAPKMFDRLLKRTRKSRRHFADLSVAGLHRFRIACKKLRYGLELYGQIYRKRDYDRLLKRLRLVQDDLGAVNDAAIARAALSKRMRGTVSTRGMHRRLLQLERKAARHASAAARHVESLMRATPFW
jgi:inorganic triphosphatase YgiF